MLFQEGDQVLDPCLLDLGASSGHQLLVLENLKKNEKSEMKQDYGFITFFFPWTISESH
jgi:hypothetical protein